MIDVKLAEYVKLCGNDPFEWGVLDCTIFTSNWCEFVTGKNPAKEAFGKYNSEETAYGLLESEYNNQPEFVVDNFFERVEPNFEQVGDVALCILNGNKTFGICAQKGLVIFKTANTILVTKQCEKLICWRVE